MKVKQISAQDTYFIRHKMLRPNGTEEDCHFKGDDDDLTFHLGAFEDSKLASVASFYFEKHPNIEASHQYRLRGMATLPEYQKKGLSSALLETAFPLIKQNQVKLLWCNARLSASGYYEKVGFKKMGNIFDIVDIGPHILMYKEID